jgi:hypothetical protein
MIIRPACLPVPWAHTQVRAVPKACHFFEREVVLATRGAGLPLRGRQATVRNVSLRGPKRRSNLRIWYGHA